MIVKISPCFYTAPGACCCINSEKMSPIVLAELELLSCLLLIASAAVSGTPDSYVAAVVEYHPHTGLHNNLQALQPLVESATSIPVTNKASSVFKEIELTGTYTSRWNKSVSHHDWNLIGPKHY